MTQLIIFRAFQGIGGGGIYCIAFILMMSIITKDKLGTFSAGISSVFAIASICGPLLGGVITERSTWRWIFYLNGPGIAVAFAILFFSIPKVGEVKLDRETLSRIDFGGGFLSVAWSILLVYALQEGGADYPWSHSIILGTLVSGIVGVPIYVTIINIPQRYQIVNGKSPIAAGVLLLPMLVTSPVMSLVPGLALKKYYVYIPYGFTVGCALALIGSAGLGSLGDGTTIPPKTYGFLILLGAGMGLVMPIGVMLVKFLHTPQDEAVALGAQNMMRILGGLVGLAIGTAIIHKKIENELPGILAPEQLRSLLKSPQILATLKPEELAAVRAVYARSYNLQFNMSTGFAALALIFAVLTTYYSLPKVKAADADAIFNQLGGGGAKPKAEEKKEEKQTEEV
ncbi:hypothetical protein ABW20_dc0107856 [Dactylellina cionopaga]|nr:hypothetical protein ABW20_dc0107856 [Dactylellina cionopaga]